MEGITRRRIMGFGLGLLALMILPAKRCDPKPPVPPTPPAPSNLNVSPVTCFDDGSRWVAYSPTNYDYVTGAFPEEDSIREDLLVLKNAGFKGVITSCAASTLGKIPAIAKEEGMKSIMGIWDIDNPGEWNNAIAARAYVEAYCMGNEGLEIKGLANSGYSYHTIESKISALRIATGRPVSTSEPSGNYSDELLAAGDFIFPNVYPYWQGITDPTQAAKWTIQEYRRLIAPRDFPVPLNRQIIMRVSLPTAGGEDLSPENQAAYRETLENLASAESSKTIFAFHEAYDQTWRYGHPTWPHEGIFDEDRMAKY